MSSDGKRGKLKALVPSQLCGLIKTFIAGLSLQRKFWEKFSRLKKFYPSSTRVTCVSCFLCLWLAVARSSSRPAANGLHTGAPDGATNDGIFGEIAQADFDSEDASHLSGPEEAQAGFVSNDASDLSGPEEAQAGFVSNDASDLSRPQEAGPPEKDTKDQAIDCEPAEDSQLSKQSRFLLLLMPPSCNNCSTETVYLAKC